MKMVKTENVSYEYTKVVEIMSSVNLWRCRI